MEQKKQIPKAVNTDIPTYIREVANKTLLKSGESTRSYIVTTIAYSDDLLTKLIKANLVMSDDKNDELFSEQSALYHLGPKIALAFRMGLISNNMRSTLNILRKMRDDCAHSHVDMSFEDSKDRIEEMFKRLNDSDSDADKSLRDQYTDVVANILVLLHQMLIATKPLHQPAPPEYIFRQKPKN